MLMHGCKEGQCAACKSFLLDGEVDLDRYSTFALPDFEEDEGYTLLCRAHALSDVEIELINYDEEIIRSGVPIVDGDRRGRGGRGADARHPPAGAQLPRARLTFNAGQYMDIAIPGADGEHRSFSMANTPGQPDRLEFMIKLYDGGHFSGLLAERQRHGIKVGDQLTCKGPVRHLHAARVARRGGWCSSPAAPGWRRSCRCCARWPRRASTRPATFYYGARTAGRPVRPRGARAPGRGCRTSASSPALSEATSGRVGRRGRPDHRRRRPPGGRPREVDAYLCGPPPMVDAAIALLERRGCAEAHIYYDKFTTTAE